MKLDGEIVEKAIDNMVIRYRLLSNQLKTEPAYGSKSCLSRFEMLKESSVIEDILCACGIQTHLINDDTPNVKISK